MRILEKLGIWHRTPVVHTFEGCQPGWIVYQQVDAESLLIGQRCELSGEGRGIRAGDYLRMRKFQDPYFFQVKVLSITYRTQEPLKWSARVEAIRANYVP